jgi:hypothetical protein
MSTSRSSNNTLNLNPALNHLLDHNVQLNLNRAKSRSQGDAARATVS